MRSLPLLVLLAYVAPLAAQNDADTAPVLLEGGAPFLPPFPDGNPRYYVAGTGDDARTGTSRAQAWRTLQRAANAAQPGDIVEVLDGSYERFTLAGRHATAQAPIVFRARGQGAVIDRGTSSSTSPDLRDAIKIVDCAHVLLHGLRTSGAFRAGCRISDSLHVTVQAGVFADGGTWGIFTDYSDDLKLYGNVCRGSVREHGIYHSNSGDRAQIVGNLCHDNRACGIQINADPRQQDPSKGTRGDGIADQCVVERNLCARNGQGGGAALNFASLRRSLVHDNLLVQNLGQSGIVLWDDGNINGGAGPGFGSKDNRIEHNTVVFDAGVGRFCLLLVNGSTGNLVRNNLLRGGARGAITFAPDSLPGLVEDYNLLASASGFTLVVDDTTGQGYSLAQWRAFTGGAAHDLAASPRFAGNGSDPWVLLPGSPGRDAGTDAGRRTSYDGTPRPASGGFDLGAYER
jgi:hypothetical protein